MNDTALLAKLIIATDKAYQADYIPAIVKPVGPSGERVITEGGYYRTTIDQALAGAIIEIANGDDDLVARLADLSIPVRLMFSYAGEAREWAEAYLVSDTRRKLDAQSHALI